MGILATILGATGVIESGMKLIDDMHTSTEEEILAKTQAKVNLMNAYAPFKVAQRVLAIMFAATFLGSFILVLAMTLAGKGEPTDVTAIVGEFWIGEIMITIVGFYFGGGFVEGALAKKSGNSSSVMKVN
jgi:hypothetical protein